jgi:hypothetical protein
MHFNLIYPISTLCLCTILVAFSGGLCWSKRVACMVLEGGLCLYWECLIVELVLVDHFVLVTLLINKIVIFLK